MANAPATDRDHLAGEARFAIQPMKRCLGVGDDRLDLHGQQRAERRMERHDVDRTTFTPDGERDLDIDDPAGASKQPYEAINEGGVGVIDQSIETLASPPEVEVDVRSERRSDVHERGDRHPVELAPIDGRDQRARDAGLRGDVLLAALLADPQGPEVPPESKSIHAAIVTPSGLPPLT